MGASRSTKPFTAHPAFPVIVALWFAALLGLGTFVVPPANFEGLVVGTGLASLVPAAAPPLGDTARLAISAAAAVMGALLGLAIAARIRRVEDEPQTSSKTIVPTDDSPWLADGDEAEVEDAPGDLPSQYTAVDPAQSDTLGAVRSRLAGRRGMNDRGAPPPVETYHAAEEEAQEPAAEAEYVFQASPVHLREDVDFDIGGDGDEEAALEATPPISDGEDEDLQRFAADRLVAGLPRFQRRNFDDDPLEDWSQPEPVVADSPSDSDLEPEIDAFAAMPDPDAAQEQDPQTRDPDFDAPEFVEEAEYEEILPEPVATVPGFDEGFQPEEPAIEPEWASYASDTPSEPSWAAEVIPDAQPRPARLDFAASSLSELVARFDTAIAARNSGSRPPETQSEPESAQPSDDPVIAFLRREADRESGAPVDAARERPDDPRAVLRNALDKLDRVSRKS